MYRHYCGPTNPIVNVETDVPRLPIAWRERLSELDKKLNRNLKGKQTQKLSTDEAYILVNRRTGSAPVSISI